VKIYLACTVRGDRSGVLAGRAICDRLQQHGHVVLTTHLLADDVEEAEAALTETQVFQRDIEWLSDCDIVVAEASGSSYGVGFEVGFVIGRARHTGQRVFLVYNSARRHAVSRLITGNCDAACTTFAYGTLNDLVAFIDRELGPERGERLEIQHSAP
jgi:nucleoside 2-deoxyribosyltransferase